MQKQASILMNVREALSPGEQIRSLLSDWLTPISGVITIIISSVSGIIGWNIGKSKQKGRKAEEKKRESNEAPQTSPSETQQRRDAFANRK